MSSILGLKELQNTERRRTSPLKTNNAETRHHLVCSPEVSAEDEEVDVLGDLCGFTGFFVRDVSPCSVVSFTLGSFFVAVSGLSESLT